MQLLKENYVKLLVDVEMRIVQINMLHFGSTGKIMFELAQIARNDGNEVLTLSPKCYRKGMGRHFKPIEGHEFFGYWFENLLHHHIAKIIGYNGYFSYLGTKQLIKILQNFRPDIVHLHNLHNWSINLPLLFKYLKKSGVQVVWTLHDCWPFTGQCPNFIMVGCDKWKTGCGHCPQLNTYPDAMLDHTAFMWKKKKKWFGNMENLNLVTPSEWLETLVRQSFLKDVPVRVINNGIDLQIFSPLQSNFRQKYNIGEDKYILLGVAFGWGPKKGLDVFLDLAKQLPEKYQIVLIGTDESIDNMLSRNIISIHRTMNQKELAEIYTAADLFVNPTREDNYPTVNMESLACGTPVLTFRTGGSSESIDETCGDVVPCDDTEQLIRQIEWICQKHKFKESDCVDKARSFDMEIKFREYLELYHTLMQDTDGETP